MKNLQLNGTARNEFGKKTAKSIRKDGDVPCVLYGGEKVVHFSTSVNDVRNLLYTPDIYTVELNIDGVKYMSILKDSQFHPVSDAPLHLDFLQIFEDKAIIMEVPVKLNGLAEGVKDGGKLSQEMRKIKVRGFYKEIPETLEINITKLGLGKTLQVGSLQFPNLEMISPKSNVVCAVKLTRVARGIAAAAAKEAGKK
jgi:large subunit ribosomal protein L25